MKNQQLSLKPQDLVILLKLVSAPEEPFTYSSIGKALFISASEVHASLARARIARLFTSDHDGDFAVAREALRELLLHGAQFVFPAVVGTLTRGIPTAHASPAMRDFLVPSDEPPPVWPYAKGTVRGIALQPLYPTVPRAAEIDSRLYETLALFDALIEAAASALGEFLDRVVFIGGCAVGLMITDTARPAVRATQHVDLIVEIGSKAEYYKLSEQLRAAGLQEDPEVICRWRLGALKIDVMPTDEGVLGFSNRWYPEAMRDARTVALPSGLEIRLISPPLLLATKIEAFYGRGGGDFGASHDIEDIVNLIDGRPELADEIGSATNDVRNYLRE